jgi:MFS family permease
MDNYFAKTALDKRLTPLYAAAFFHGFVLWYAIEKLFMHTIGFNDTGIGVMVAAYCAVILLAETPTGILADRWSRKGILVLASVMLPSVRLSVALAPSRRYML